MQDFRRKKTVSTAKLGAQAVVASKRLAAAAGKAAKGQSAKSRALKIDVAEDIVCAAEQRILVETGVESAAEVVRRMCGGHDELEVALKGEITDTERRIRWGCIFTPHLVVCPFIHTLVWSSVHSPHTHVRCSTLGLTDEVKYKYSYVFKTGGEG